MFMSMYLCYPIALAVLWSAAVHPLPFPQLGARLNRSVRPLRCLCGSSSFTGWLSRCREHVRFRSWPGS